MKATVENIKSHYLGNLEQLSFFWELVELWIKVKEVKDKEDFVDFMLKKYEQWELQVNILELYFVKRDNE